MTTIICATNRPKNQTRKVVEAYRNVVEKTGDDARVFSMEELPPDFIFNDSFGRRTTPFSALVETHIHPAEKLVIVAPEYNGSYPGIFKAFLDANNPKIWEGKKVALVGVASGRAGNIRGLDHLVQVCHHLKMLVSPLQIPISRLDSLMEENGAFSHQITLDLFAEQYNQLTDL